MTRLGGCACVCLRAQTVCRPEVHAWLDCVVIRNRYRHREVDTFHKIPFSSFDVKRGRGNSGPWLFRSGHRPRAGRRRLPPPGSPQSPPLPINCPSRRGVSCLVSLWPCECVGRGGRSERDNGVFLVPVTVRRRKMTGRLRGQRGFRWTEDRCVGYKDTKGAPPPNAGLVASWAPRVQPLLCGGGSGQGRAGGRLCCCRHFCVRTSRGAQPSPSQPVSISLRTT